MNERTDDELTTLRRRAGLLPPDAPRGASSVDPLDDAGHPPAFLLATWPSMPPSLGPEEAALVHEHLAACAECADTLAAYSSFRGAAGDPVLPPVAAAASARESNRPRWPLWGILGAALLWGGLQFFERFALPKYGSHLGSIVAEDAILESARPAEGPPPQRIDAGVQAFGRSTALPLDPEDPAGHPDEHPPLSLQRLTNGDGGGRVSVTLPSDWPDSGAIVASVFTRQGSRLTPPESLRVEDIAGGKSLLIAIPRRAIVSKARYVLSLSLVHRASLPDSARGSVSYAIVLSAPPFVDRQGRLVP